MSENIEKHLADIDQVLCDQAATTTTISSHLGRIAMALEALVEQGKVKPVAKVTPTDEAVVKKSSKKKAVEKVEEVVGQVEEVKTFTHADLKAACLTSARADSDNRDKLKALLKTYGAVKAVDVPKDKLEEVITKIEAGEF